MRLDRYLANNTGLTRKQVKQALKAGDVCLDGLLVHDPSIHISLQSNVLLGGQRVLVQGPVYLMMNKPEGYVCANRDSEHPVVFDLLQEIETDDLHLAGRLDMDTTGLLLITNDGKWSHRVTSPKAQCAKRYRVGLAEPLTEPMVERLTEGLLLEGELKRTLPAIVERIDHRHCFLTISEGRYHQVKRMFAAVGNHVCLLHRDRIGEIHLDPELALGEYRTLTGEEVSSVL